MDYQKILAKVIEDFFSRNKFNSIGKLEWDPVTEKQNKRYFEKKGSAQIKSCIMLAALNAPGATKIKAKKSRNHTELLYKFLKLPIKVINKKSIDFIEINGEKKINSFDYNIPSDISSSAFFIVLTLLSNKSHLIIKNVNINSSRTGCIDILNKMGANIILKNKKYYNNV